MNVSKKEMIDKITNNIKNLGEQAQQDKNLSLEEKASQVDVLLDTLKFLSNYEENVMALNKYYAAKGRWPER